MVPPLDHFQGKNKNCSSFARMISASRRSFFANLATFERRFGLKKFSLLKIAILKMGLKFGPNRATNSWDIYCSGWVELVAEPMCRVGGVGCGAYVSVGEIENKAISTSIDLNWIELNWVEVELGKNWVSNSWDIHDMDKCCQDKCCLDKNHITVGICSRCSQEPTIKVWSISAQW